MDDSQDNSCVSKEHAIGQNQERWEESAEIHPDTEYYNVSRFLREESYSTLQSPELELIGDVSNQSLVHLQCHIGLDTLSWARQGALTVGVDFASSAIETAREIRDQAGLTEKSEFVHCKVSEAATRLNREFDIVFASYGVLCWIPDVQSWAKTAASLCKSDGTIFLADYHPVLHGINPDGKLSKDRSYFTDKPTSFQREQTYASGKVTLQNTDTYEWQHGLGEVVTAFTRAGLQVETLREYLTIDFPKLESMVRTEDGRYALPGDPVPLMYALRASPNND